MYKTGDMGRWLPDGAIEFLGRVDFQVKIRGFRIEPGEIESVLSAHGRVKEAVVIAREDPTGAKRLAAYLTPGGKGSAPDPGELTAFLKAKLPDYMIPSSYTVLDALPLTPSGKIDRKALPEPDSDRLRAHAFVAPGNETEEMIAEIWRELLHIENVGVHDNFFEMGGHSLFATVVASRLREKRRMKIPVKRLFEYPTISELADYIEALASPGESADPGAAGDEEIEISF